MGCDIHLRVEEWDNGRWFSVGEVPEVPEVTWEDGYPVDPDPYPFERVYCVFAFVGDVRNYQQTASHIARRGLPEDLEVEDNGRFWTDANGDMVYLGDHSHTWATLEELVALPWGDPVIDEDGPDDAATLRIVIAKSGLRRWAVELATRYDPTTTRVLIGFGG